MDPGKQTSQDTSTVVELRQYTLHPGQRDVLVDLFDREFIETQEAVGMRVLGQFRDKHDPNRFVWLRGFADMPSRAGGLQSFYGGPVWKMHRNAANATMVDSDNVLLLRPVDAQSGVPVRTERPPVGTLHRASSHVMATIYLLEAPVDQRFLQFFERRVRPIMVETGAEPIARYQTEYAANNFPALPVREGEHAFVWLASFADADAYHRHVRRLEDSKMWNEQVEPELAELLVSPPQVLLLEPTSRSTLGRLEPFAPERTGDSHDFDFLAGSWSIAHRRLRERGVGSNDWDDFRATFRADLHMGGVVNVDEMSVPSRGWSGMSIRVFNAEKRQWSIYWINSQKGVMEPPVRGGFAGDRGEFYGEDVDNGRPVTVRFIWTRLGRHAARWEQAFSYDGREWETNWVMDFTRDRNERPGYVRFG